MRAPRAPITARAVVAVVLLASAPPARADDVPRFQDPLLTPAETIGGAARPERQPLLAVTRAGRRLVAVGLRGLVIVSDDDGRSWRQVPVPVQSDLVAVTFVSATRGWAVGHEGVILTTEDGGGTWKKQLDGAEGAAALVEHYQRRLDAGEAALSRVLAQVKLNTQNGPSLPYLDVLFEDERVGYAIGPFGTIVRTEDSGATWVPWLEHVDNDEFLNLNAIARIGGEVYIAGEGGRVYQLDRRARRFVAHATGYRGSFFGLVGAEDTLVAYGLRGTVYRSDDAGRSWRRAPTGVGSNLTGGVMGRDGKTVTLVADGGVAIQSRDAARTFDLLPTAAPMLFTGAVEAESEALVLVGFQGIGAATVTTNPRLPEER